MNRWMALLTLILSWGGMAEVVQAQFVDDPRADLASRRDRGNLRIKPFFWGPQIDGRLRVTNSGDNPTNVSMEQQLGLGSPDHIERFEDVINRHMGFEVQLNSKKFTLAFSYFQSEYEGFTTLDGPFNYDGTDFSPGIDLKTEVEYQGIDGMIQFDIVSKKPVFVSFIVGGKFIHMEVDFTSTSVSERDRTDIVTPYVGLAIEIDLGKYVTVYGRAVGMTFSWSRNTLDIDRYEFFQWQVGIMVNPAPLLSFGVEYRQLYGRFRGSKSDESVEFRLRLGGTNDHLERGLSFFVMLKF